jgi:hypothetical protein
MSMDDLERVANVLEKMHALLKVMNERIVNLETAVYGPPEPHLSLVDQVRISAVFGVDDDDDDD